MKEKMKKLLKLCAVWLLVFACVLSICSCFAKPDEGAEGLEDSTPPDTLQGFKTMKDKQGNIFPVSDEDWAYLDNLIKKSEKLPDCWKSSADYDFVFEDAAWAYSVDHGSFNNWEEEISLPILNDSQQARMSEIIAAAKSGKA